MALELVNFVQLNNDDALITTAALIAAQQLR
jgi:hypothetical protein